MKKGRQTNANEPSQRQLRVGEQLRHIIAETLRRGHFNNEILLDRSADITVSEVRTSPDLKHARAYASTMNSEIDLEEMLELLNAEAHVFQRAIGNSANLKFTPRVRFVIDESQEYAQRIEDLLRGITLPAENPDEED